MQQENTGSAGLSLPQPLSTPGFNLRTNDEASPTALFDTDDELTLIGHPHPPMPSQARGVERPIARVLVDAPVLHMARTFDYLVPPSMNETAQAGVRVVVQVGSHKNLDGWIIERDTHTSHMGILIDITKVVSPLPVLTPQLLTLAQAVSQRCACTIPDVLRLAIPPRHARVEKAFLTGMAQHKEQETRPELTIKSTTASAHISPSPHSHDTDRHVANQPDTTTPSALSTYDGGTDFTHALIHYWDNGGQRPPRATWTWVGHGEGINPDPWDELVNLIAHAHQAQRSVLVLCPTSKQAQLFLDHAQATIGHVPAALITSRQGHSERYRSYCRALTGQACLVVGTRSAAYAPLVNPGLIIMIDDVSPHYVEQRSPYAHTRTVASLRSTHDHVPLLIAGLTRSVETQAWVQASWAQSISAPRALKRAVVAKVHAPTYNDLDAEGASGHTRIPSRALTLIRRALHEGPVLVQVAHAVARPVLICSSCRALARCHICQSAITPPHHHPPQPRHYSTWSGYELHCVLAQHPYVAHPCWRCGSSQQRIIGGGAVRTADELARSLPKIPVIYSTTPTGDDSVDTINNTARVVVATPGNEPVAQHGYRGVVILDAWALSSKPQLGSGSQALAVWAHAISLAHPNASVLLLGDPDPTLAAALVRWDMEGYAQRELHERAELHLPPMWRTARIEGSKNALHSLTASLQSLVNSDYPIEVLGPFPSESSDETRWVQVIRCAAAHGKELSTALHAIQQTRSAHRVESVTVNCDPATLW